MSRHKNIKWWKKSVPIEIKNKHPTLLFIAYIEVTLLNLQHKIQLKDTSVISFKTENLLKTYQFSNCFE